MIVAKAECGTIGDLVEFIVNHYTSDRLVEGSDLANLRAVATTEHSRVFVTLVEHMDGTRTYWIGNHYVPEDYA